MEQMKYDVFISYSRKDYVDEHKVVIPGNEVSKIIDALEKAGITYWFDEQGIYFGDKFTEKIPESIEASHIFLFLSTKNACESSWTSREIACADVYGKYIIPVRIDRTPYNNRVMLRIADLSYVDYGKNPEKGRQEIVKSIKDYLKKIKTDEEKRLAEEKAELERKKEIERKKSEDVKRRREEDERYQKELQKQLIEYIRTSVKELNIEETKLDLERSKLLVKTEKVTDIGQHESLKTEITESSPIRKKTVAEIEKLRKIVADLEAKWNDEVGKNEALLKELADKESENGALREEIEKQYRKNKWVNIGCGCIIFFLISVIFYLLLLNSEKNRPGATHTIPFDTISESHVNCNLEFQADSILEFNVDGIKFNMIWVEGGTFKMGDTLGEDDEKPVHDVTLDSYYIGEAEVTQALWEVVMGNTVDDQRKKNYHDLDTKGEGDDYPMYYVSWEGCQRFIKKLDSITGNNFRLPTEAEWEYAARGGKKSNGYKFSGCDIIDVVAWYYENSGLKTHKVKTKSPNELGIYDMSGNVFEWCQDKYGGYTGTEQIDPQESSSGSSRKFRGLRRWFNLTGNRSVSPRDKESRVLRGGGWFNPSKDCRVSRRGRNNSNDESNLIGFRLVLP